MSRGFSLAGLLRVKSLQERAAAEHLSRANIARQQTEAREHRLRRSLAANDDVATDTRTLAAVAATRVATRSQLSDLRVLAKVQDAEVEQARAAHQSARIEEHGLTKLADAHAQRELARALQKEQNELDEIAVRRRTEEPK